MWCFGCVFPHHAQESRNCGCPESPRKLKAGEPGGASAVELQVEAVDKPLAEIPFTRGPQMARAPIDNRGQPVVDRPLHPHRCRPRRVAGAGRDDPSSLNLYPTGGRSRTLRRGRISHDEFADAVHRIRQRHQGQRSTQCVDSATRRDRDHRGDRVAALETSTRGQLTDRQAADIAQAMEASATTQEPVRPQLPDQPIYLGDGGAAVAPSDDLPERQWPVEERSDDSACPGFREVQRCQPLPGVGTAEKVVPSAKKITKFVAALTVFVNDGPRRTRCLTSDDHRHLDHLVDMVIESGPRQGIISA